MSAVFYISPSAPQVMYIFQQDSCIQVTCAFVPWYVGKGMEHREYSRARKVITTQKKCYEDNVGSGEESGGAKGYRNVIKNVLCGIFYLFYVKKVNLKFNYCILILKC